LQLFGYSVVGILQFSIVRSLALERVFWFSASNFVKVNECKT